MTRSPGLFITLEGGEGAGKSTQSDELARRLEARGELVARTREPGGTPLGERLRAVLLDFGERRIALDPLTETLLFVAARAELVKSVVAPALERDETVICDRFADSTRAYQGFGRGVDLAIIDRLNDIATGGLQPDLTVLLDLAPAEGLARAEHVDDRFGREERSFHELVREGYHALAAREPRRWHVIDAGQRFEAVADEIWRRVKQLLDARAR